MESFFSKMAQETWGGGWRQPEDACILQLSCSHPVLDCADCKGKLLLDRPHAVFSYASKHFIDAHPARTPV
jgi:hypothetical protein